MEIAAYDLRYMRARAAEHRRLEQDVQAISEPDYQPRAYELALPPRDYQRAAADMLLRRDSLLLADDLGVGKSVSAICTLVAPDALPALIVVPKHLQRQWQREINRFAPGLSTTILRSGKPYDLRKIQRRQVPYPDVIICTYMKLVGWADTLAGVVKTVVFDEVQELRHSGTGKYDAAKFVADKADRRLALSATPVHNYGGEIWTVLNVLSPGELGDFGEFTREWCRSQAGYGGTSKAIIDG
jgi:SNF2 family DNA or RNA helicase